MGRVNFLVFLVCDQAQATLEMPTISGTSMLFVCVLYACDVRSFAWKYQRGKNRIFVFCVLGKFQMSAKLCSLKKCDCDNNKFVQNECIVITWKDLIRCLKAEIMTKSSSRILIHMQSQASKHTHTHAYTFIYLKAEELELEPRVVNAVRGISSLSVSRIFVPPCACVSVRACVFYARLVCICVCTCARRVLVVKQKKSPHERNHRKSGNIHNLCKIYWPGAMQWAASR